MHHHGKGVYSGTFSGTLNPALQDRHGRPKRDISTIIHILNDLLCATPAASAGHYRHHHHRHSHSRQQSSSISTSSTGTSTTASGSTTSVGCHDSITSGYSTGSYLNKNMYIISIIRAKINAIEGGCYVSTICNVIISSVLYNLYAF